MATYGKTSANMKLETAMTHFTALAYHLRAVKREIKDGLYPAEDKDIITQYWGRIQGEITEVRKRTYKLIKLKKAGMFTNLFAIDDKVDVDTVVASQEGSEFQTAVDAESLAASQRSASAIDDPDEMGSVMSGSTLPWGPTLPTAEGEEDAFKEVHKKTTYFKKKSDDDLYEGLESASTVGSNPSPGQGSASSGSNPSGSSVLSSRVSATLTKSVGKDGAQNSVYKVVEENFGKPSQ